MARMTGVRSARFTDSQNKPCRKANISTGSEPLLDAPRIVGQQLPGQPRGTREPLVPRTIRGSVQCTLEELTYRTEREVTLELIARPLIEALSGTQVRKLVFTHAKLNSEIRTKTGLKRFLPAILSGEFERAEVELVRWQGSGDIVSLARSNCFLVIPPDRERLEPGEWVPVLLR